LATANPDISDILERKAKEAHQPQPAKPVHVTDSPDLVECHVGRAGRPIRRAGTAAGMSLVRLIEVENNAHDDDCRRAKANRRNPQHSEA